jgi:iron complex outermembrane receptor protein
MLHSLRNSALIAFICSAAAAHAQDISPDSTSTAIPVPIASQRRDLTPVEVRALRAATDAPFAKTEFSGRDLQKENLGQDLPFLLQYTPSAVVTSDAGAGVGYTGLRLRGTDGTRINVTLNGIPVNDAESQGSFFVDLPDLASSTTSIPKHRRLGSSTNCAAPVGGTFSGAHRGI